MLCFEPTVPITDARVQNVVKTSAGVNKTGIVEHMKLFLKKNLTEGLRDQEKNLSPSCENSNCYPLATGIKNRSSKEEDFAFLEKAKTLK